jgi:putative transposase
MCYHVLNRGNGRAEVFHKQDDYAAFLRLLPLAVERTAMRILAFCLMPNHFHLIVKELEEEGISHYMQRVLNSYSKYYNTKYSRSGHVFQGPYQAVHIQDNRQLLHLSAYIHRNPREIEKWRGREEEYPWSSYQNFLSGSRWGDLLVPGIVTEQFKGQSGYKKFVETSPTKLLEEELGHLVVS